MESEFMCVLGLRIEISIHKFPGRAHPAKTFNDPGSENFLQSSQQPVFYAGKLSKLLYIDSSSVGAVD